MAAPSYVNAGAGATDAGGAWTYTGAAPAAAGNLLIFQAIQDGATSGAVALTGATNVEDLAGTDNAWTSIGEYTVGTTFSARHHLWVGRSLSTTAATASGTNSTSEDLYMRMYEFSGVNTGTTLSAVLENGSAGTVLSQGATSAAVFPRDVVTLAADRLACCFIAVNDDIQAAELTAMTGETGGDWAYPVAAYGDASGTDGTLALVTATMASAGTISGGSDAITSAAWGVACFALIPATASFSLYPGSTNRPTSTLYNL